jgi:hypothetical protein
MNEVIKNYIDKGIDFVYRHKEYLMYQQEVQPEMILDFDYNLVKEMSVKVELEQDGATGELLEIMKPTDKVWKPVDCTMTPNQIEKIEQTFNISLPSSYKEYLFYKHFYKIFLNADIRLYPKPITEWLNVLIDNNTEMKKFVLDNGYFAIGEYSDYGIICFNLNENKEDPSIVMLDQETAEPEHLSDNFIELLKSALDISEPIIKELKPWQKRLYKME